MHRLGILIVAVLFINIAPTYAKDRHAPLPESIIVAKTAYIDNEAGAASFADRCYDELSKWGRYSIVTDPQKADIVFRLTTEVHTVGYTHNASATATDNGAYATGTSRAIRKGTTYLEIVDPKTSTVLWTDSRGYGLFHSATKGIIKELRDRVEEQQKLSSSR